mmetsp:Transcript_598/g.2127  ORF Transcript_598/g.2127 Transcript_598/m.2127 type:complete len:1113 (+) Transcript_598:976-4314(+)
MRHSSGKVHESRAKKCRTRTSVCQEPAASRACASASLPADPNASLNSPSGILKNATLSAIVDDSNMAPVHSPDGSSQPPRASLGALAPSSNIFVFGEHGRLPARVLPTRSARQSHPEGRREGITNAIPKVNVPLRKRKSREDCVQTPERDGLLSWKSMRSNLVPGTMSGASLAVPSKAVPNDLVEVTTAKQVNSKRPSSWQRKRFQKQQQLSSSCGTAVGQLVHPSGSLNPSWSSEVQQLNQKSPSSSVPNKPNQRKPRRQGNRRTFRAEPNDMSQHIETTNSKHGTKDSKSSSHHWQQDVPRRAILYCHKPAPSNVMEAFPLLHSCLLGAQRLVTQGRRHRHSQEALVDSEMKELRVHARPFGPSLKTPISITDKRTNGTCHERATHHVESDDLFYHAGRCLFYMIFRCPDTPTELWHPKKIDVARVATMKVPKSQEHMIKLLQQLVRRASEIPIQQLLGRYCPFRDSITGSNTSREQTGKLKVRPIVVTDSRGPSFRPESGKDAATCRAPSSERSNGVARHERKSPGHGSARRKVRWRRKDILPCSNESVASFLWSVLRQLVGPALLGSKYNCNKLRGNVRCIVRMRIHEKINLHALAQKMRLRDFPWMWPLGVPRGLLVKATDSSCHKEDAKQPRKQAHPYPQGLQLRQRKWLRRWLIFLVNGIVIPLIRSYFYVTEGETTRMRTLFYTKSVWKVLQDRARSELLRTIWSSMNRHTFRALLQSGRRHRLQLGVPTVRFIPKNLSEPPRLITRYGAGSVVPSTMWRSIKETANKRQLTAMKLPINKRLQGLFLALKWECMNKDGRKKLGASTFSLNDVYDRYRRFVHKSREARSTFHLACVDVKKAYDSIRPALVKEMAERMLSMQEYLLVKYQRQWFDGVKIRYANCEEAICSGRFPQFADFVASKCRESRQSIFTDRAQYSYVTREDCIEFLDELLEGNIVRCGKKYFWQRVGIPQGANVSPLLCSLYYGQMEQRLNFTCSDRHVPTTDGSRKTETPENAVRHRESGEISRSLSGAAKDGYAKQALCLRRIDDFLLISNDKKSVQSLLELSHTGVNLFNCTFKAVKTRCNVGQDKRNLFVDEVGNEFLPWVGLLLNCGNLEVQADYTR